MGAATIVTNKGDGLYTIKKTITGIDGELAKLAIKRLELEKELPILTNTLRQYWDELTAYREAVNALIDQWKNDELAIDPSDEDEPTDPDGNPIVGEDFCNEVIELVNLERAVVGSSALAKNTLLTRAAQFHANWMGANNTLSHTGRDGTNAQDRIEEAGYVIKGFGENVGAGANSPEKIVAAWMRSPGHRANILQPLFEEIGVGLALTTSGTYQYWWVQNFGAPR
jgi:hypothetical protein